MIPGLVVGIACLYKKREEHPYWYAILIVLLANTHVIMGPMAGMLVLFFWGEKLLIKQKDLNLEEKKVLWKSFGIVVLGFLILIAQVLPAVVTCQLFTEVQCISKKMEWQEVWATLRTSFGSNNRKFI